MELSIQDLQRMQLKLLKEVIRICDENDVTYYAAYGTVLGAIRHKGFIPWDGDIDIYVRESELEKFIQAMKENLNEEFWVDYRDDRKKYRDFPRIGYKGFDTNLLHVDVFRLAGAPSDKKGQRRLRKITGTIHHIMNVKQKGFMNYVISGRKTAKAFFVTIGTGLIPLHTFARIIDYYSKKYPFETAEYVGNSTSGAVYSIFPKSYLGDGIMVQFEDIQIRIPSNFDAYLTQMYQKYMDFPPFEERERALNYVFRVVTNPKTGLKTLVYK